MTTLYLSYTENKTGGYPLSDEPYSCREDVDIDWHLDNCYKTKELCPYLRQENEVDFDVNIGDYVYVVYVIYKSGDSFTEIYGAWEIVGVYKTPEEAIKVKESIENNTYKGYTPWNGYFESFSNCDIGFFVVK